MNMVINGEKRVLDVKTVSALVAELGLSNTRIAVELNRKVVRRQDWEHTFLAENDQVELVQFVGGG